MPDKHARISPSNASRWLNCPGSVALSEQCPPPPTSEYAEEGTRAHALAESFLRWNTEEIGDEGYREALDKINPDGEMLEAVQFYGDTVLPLLSSYDAELLIEQRFPLTDWIPGGFGFSDAIVISSSVINVIDFKYGKGVRVDAKDNPQLRLYGAGAAALFQDVYDYDTVRMTIVQPRLDHVSTEELSLSNLLRWADEIVAPRAREALTGSDRFSCGDWCRFCPAKAICRKRAEANLELAQMEFRQPPALTTEEISEVLRKAEDLKTWASDVCEYALSQALEGEHYDGWKVVEGRSNRKYADELQVAEKLRGAGFDDAVLYERKLNGITAMEKIVGKKKLAEILGGLIVKPAGKPCLVPETDKRPEYHSAKEDFKE